MLTIQCSFNSVEKTVIAVFHSFQSHRMTRRVFGQHFPVCRADRPCRQSLQCFSHPASHSTSFEETPVPTPAPLQLCASALPSQIDCSLLWFTLGGLFCCSAWFAFLASIPLWMVVVLVLFHTAQGPHFGVRLQNGHYLVLDSRLQHFLSQVHSNKGI